MSELNSSTDPYNERLHSDPDRLLDALDSAQAEAHTHERAVPLAAAPFLKDDRRSSDRLTKREASERWPLG